MQAKRFALSRAGLVSTIKGIIVIPGRKPVVAVVILVFKLLRRRIRMVHYNAKQEAAERGRCYGASKWAKRRKAVEVDDGV